MTLIRPVHVLLLTSTLLGACAAERAAIAQELDAAAATSPATELELQLSGSHRTPHFELRYRPGSRAGGRVDRLGALIERDVVLISELLELDPKGPFVLWMFDSGTELVDVTGVDEPEGFTRGRQIYLPLDSECRFHEVVHAVAHDELSHTGPDGTCTKSYLAEGLAMALEHGPIVHASAKLTLSRGALPRIAELSQEPGLHAWAASRPAAEGYEIAGSWMRFLLDTYGVASVKRHYQGYSARDAFGAEQAELEREWRSFLESFHVRPELEALVRESRGESVAFTQYRPRLRIPDELAPTAPDWAATSTAELRPHSAGDWTREGETIRAATSSDEWSSCAVGSNSLRDVGVALRFRPGTAQAIGIRVGEASLCMVTSGRAMLGGVDSAFQAESSPWTGEAPVDVVVARRGTDCRLWVDGKFIGSRPTGGTEGALVLLVYGGEATFEELRVRRLE